MAGPKSARSEIKDQMIRVAQAKTGAPGDDDWDKQPNSEPIDVYGTRAKVQAAKARNKAENVPDVTGDPGIDRILNQTGKLAGKATQAITSTVKNTADQMAAEGHAKGIINQFNKAKQAGAKAGPAPAQTPKLSTDDLAQTQFKVLKSAPLFHANSDMLGDDDVKTIAKMNLRNTQAGKDLSEADLEDAAGKVVQQWNDYKKTGYASKPQTPEEAQAATDRAAKHQANLKQRALSSAKKDMVASAQGMGLRQPRKHASQKSPGEREDWHNLRGRQLKYAALVARKYQDMKAQGITDEAQLSDGIAKLRPYAQSLGLKSDKSIARVEQLGMGTYHVRQGGSHHAKDPMHSAEGHLRGKLAKQGMGRDEIDALMHDVKMANHAMKPMPRMSSQIRTP